MVHTVAVRQNLSRLLDGIVYERNLHPAVNRSSGQAVFPRSHEFGEFVDNQTWYELIPGQLTSVEKYSFYLYLCLTISVCLCVCLSVSLSVCLSV